MTNLGVALALVVVIVLWVASELSKCKSAESSPGYSPDKKFYYQMQHKMCRDDARSRSTLVMGESGKPDKAVLLEFGPSLDTMNISWGDGPELHVTVSQSAISKRYGPYDELPRVVVTNP